MNWSKSKQGKLSAEYIVRVRLDNTVTSPKFAADSGEKELGKAEAEVQ